jgi:hypothetical protein
MLGKFSPPDLISSYSRSSSSLPNHALVTAANGCCAFALHRPVDLGKGFPG